MKEYKGQFAFEVRRTPSQLQDIIANNLPVTSNFHPFVLRFDQIWILVLIRQYRICMQLKLKAAALYLSQVWPDLMMVCPFSPIDIFPSHYLLFYFTSNFLSNQSNVNHHHPFGQWAICILKLRLQSNGLYKVHPMTKVCVNLGQPFLHVHLDKQANETKQTQPIYYLYDNHIPSFRIIDEDLEKMRRLFDGAQRESRTWEILFTFLTFNRTRLFRYKFWKPRNKHCGW